MLGDHLTQKKGMSKEAALDVISEEFVNYNRLPGRGRDYLESIGLLWFYNYKLRITKVALKMARERPLTALMMVGGVEPLFGADTVFSSSLPDPKTGRAGFRVLIDEKETLEHLAPLGTGYRKRVHFAPENSSFGDHFPSLVISNPKGWDLRAALVEH